MDWSLLCSAVGAIASVCGCFFGIKRDWKKSTIAFATSTLVFAISFILFSFN